MRGKKSVQRGKVRGNPSDGKVIPSVERGNSPTKMRKSPQQGTRNFLKEKKDFLRDIPKTDKGYLLKADNGTF